MNTDTKPLVTFEAPATLLARFDKVVAAKYTNRSAFLRELMAREVDAFFGSITSETQDSKEA